MAGNEQQTANAAEQRPAAAPLPASPAARTRRPIPGWLWLAIFMLLWVGVTQAVLLRSGFS